jgi:O-methyltransferase
MKPMKNLARKARSAFWSLGSRLKRSRKGAWSHERSPELLHSRLRTGATYSPWLSDREFLNAYQAVKGFTLVDIYRCYELWDLAKQAASVEGAILEVGVWRGGTGCLLAVAAPAKTVYLADTFQGMVKVGVQDTRYVGGEHADASVEIVQNLLGSLGAANARLLKGIFPEETGSNLEGLISLLHIDVDVYQSGKDVVVWSLPRLPVGAAIVFDDYGFLGCEGITRLVHELRASLGNFAFIHNLNGHAIFIRTAGPR